VISVATGSELIESFSAVHDHPDVFVYKGKHGPPFPKFKEAYKTLDEELVKQQKVNKKVTQNPPVQWLKGTNSSSPIWYIYTSGT
jgi:hypothetical protein